MVVWIAHLSSNLELFNSTLFLISTELLFFHWYCASAHESPSIVTEFVRRTWHFKLVTFQQHTYANIHWINSITMFTIFQSFLLTSYYIFFCQKVLLTTDYHIQKPQVSMSSLTREKFMKCKSVVLSSLLDVLACSAQVCQQMAT